MRNVFQTFFRNQSSGGIVLMVCAIAAITIAKSFNSPCEETYFVGDTMVDMQTAVNAKMIGIGVLWGFRDEEELMEHGATFVVKHPLDILEIVKNRCV